MGGPGSVWGGTALLAQLAGCSPQAAQWPRVTERCIHPLLRSWPGGSRSASWGSIHWALSGAHQPLPGRSTDWGPSRVLPRGSVQGLIPITSCPALSTADSSDRQRLLVCSAASRTLGWIGVHAACCLQLWSSRGSGKPAVRHSDPLAPLETGKKCRHWWNSLWRSRCASEMLLLDSLYSYNPNGSLKIKADVIFGLFSAECSVTLVLPLSLQNTNISWIELDFGVGPAFPHQCHFGFFSRGGCSAAPELLLEKHLQPPAALLSDSSLQWEPRECHRRWHCATPSSPASEWSVLNARVTAAELKQAQSPKSRVYKRFKLGLPKWDGNLFFFCLLGISHYVKWILDDNCQCSILYWFNSISNFTSTFCMHLP